MLTDEGDGYLPITEIDPATLGTFSCGKPRLDVTAQALTLHEASLGFTSVVFHQQFEGPVGYFTLANDAIKHNDSEKFYLGFGEHVELPAFPSVNIGRLAVHQDLQRKGVGPDYQDAPGRLQGPLSTSAAASTEGFQIG